MDEELFEYLFVTGQLDETFGLKQNEDDLENTEEIEIEEESYGGRGR